VALVDGCVAYWSLDGNGTDATLRGNDLTNVGASWVPGLIGQAADCEASESDYLWCADNADLSMGDIDMTVAAWIKIETGAGIMAIVAKDHQGVAVGQDREYCLQITAGGGATFYVSGDGAAIKQAAHPDVLSNGVWYFLVGYHNAATNLIGISVNDGAFTTAAHATGIFDGGTDLWVGGRADTTHRYFDGLIDCVGIWKRVLSAAEITALYNGGAGLAYPFTTGGKGFPVLAHHWAQAFGLGM